MLSLENVSTFHGRVQALYGVSLEVRNGEILALIGANGAGKSTLLGTVAGLHLPASGSIRLDGKEISRKGAEWVVRSGVSLVPERRQVFSSLSVRENLMMGAYSTYRQRKSSMDADIAQQLALFPRLEGMQNRLGGSLSGGEQQMLAIARGLMSRPSVLMLDEPSLGLAPMVVQEIMRKLLDLREREGTTILLVEQNARAALKVADRCCVLERGRVVLSGTPKDLLQDPAVRAAYLGKGYRAVGEEMQQREGAVDE